MGQDSYLSKTRSKFYGYQQDITAVLSALREQYPQLEPSDLKQIAIDVLTAVRRKKDGTYIVPSLPEKTYEELVVAVQELELL